MISVVIIERSSYQAEYAPLIRLHTSRSAWNDRRKEVHTSQQKTHRNELLNFLPLATWVGMIVFTEIIRVEWLGRGLAGVTLVVFYWISIRMVFKKNLSKWLIALIIFPVTAFFVYIIMLFLAPRPKTCNTFTATEGSVETSRTSSPDSKENRSAEPADPADKQ